jgi:hypothetical protein
MADSGARREQLIPPISSRWLDHLRQSAINGAHAGPIIALQYFM